MFINAKDEIILGNTHTVKWFNSTRARRWLELLDYDPAVVQAGLQRIIDENRSAMQYAEYNVDNVDHLRDAFNRYTSGEWTPAVIMARFDRGSMDLIRSRWKSLGLFNRAGDAYKNALHLHNAWLSSGLSMRQYEKDCQLSVNSLSLIFNQFGLPTAREAMQAA